MLRRLTSNLGAMVKRTHSGKYADWSREQLLERLLEVEEVVRRRDGLDAKRRRGENNENLKDEENIKTNLKDNIKGEDNLKENIKREESHNNNLKEEEPKQEKKPLETTLETKPIETKPIEEISTKVATRKKQRAFDFSKYSQRYVAIRFSYLGWNYSGLAYQQEPTPLPTIEEEMLKVLHMAKLIESPNPDTCKFSRCGRTDKGVSAMNQVIALNLRSSVDPDNQADPAFDEKEIPYITIMNSLLPADIRVHSICMRPPPGFDARFSCEYRHYKYLFKKDDLDLDLMREAANNYLGSNDFRNFCKIDGSKGITNYRRQVYSAGIEHHKDDFYVFNLKGTAFLWHQVRCMMAIMFLVGQRLEHPSIVLDLLDVEKYPRRPVYEMANDTPLVLYDCLYPEMEWKTALDFTSAQAKVAKSFGTFKGLLHDLEVKCLMAQMLESFFMKDADKIKPIKGSGTMNVGNGSGRNFSRYTPLSQREVLETYMVINARHKEKKALRKEREREREQREREKEQEERQREEEEK